MNLCSFDSVVIDEVHLNGVPHWSHVTNRVMRFCKATRYGSIVQNVLMLLQDERGWDHIARRGSLMSHNLGITIVCHNGCVDMIVTPYGSIQPDKHEIRAVNQAWDDLYEKHRITRAVAAANDD